MPALTVRAHFPLGVFQGHAEDGSPSRIPDTARLYSALINAAGNGTEAEFRKGQLRLSSESVAALSWLEHHPPTRIMIPDHVPAFGRAAITSYRDDGTAERLPKSRTGRIRKSSRTISTSTALSGAVGWLWDDAPTHVVETVGRLCSDVSCLGESDSPVVLTLEHIDATHEIVSEPSELHPRGVAVRTPGPGRLEELEKAWEAEHPAKLPTKTQDRPKLTEHPAGSRIPNSALRALQYERLAPSAPSSDPWTTALIMAVSEPFKPHEVVDWCVAAHRMLVARMGDSAPASVTGSYAKGVERPANRVAIQYIPASCLPRLPLAGNPESEFASGALAVLLPADLAPEDQLEITSALNAPNKRVWKRGADGSRQSVELRDAHLIGLHEFWPEVHPGWHRTWRSIGGLIPETRRQPDHPELGHWGFEQAALLSLAHVFRDHLECPPTRDYWAMIEAVSDVSRGGGSVLATHRIADSRITRYVHKAPKSMGVVQPYSATLDLGALVGDRTLIAIGQSRHLGGGLLVPVDSPEES
ncbi:MAG: type I-U CRISPR-associated protein Csb2 [Propionibacterium sp.]|nr:type I-U CRISPR-associated protein Csb2 [Propionibacterium sp.]